MIIVLEKSDLLAIAELIDSRLGQQEKRLDAKLEQQEKKARRQTGAAEK